MLYRYYSCVSVWNPIQIFIFSGGKRNGFFIEAGALDGQQHSNTLLFEIERNYTGKFMLKT